MVGQKIRIYPTKEQQSLLEECFGYSRWAYNAALSKWKELYEAGSKPRERQVRDELKASLPDWAAKSILPKSIIDTSCEHLGEAFNAFFAKRAKYPKFKSKHNTKQSFELYRKNEYSLNFKEDRWVFLKEHVKMSERLRFTGTPKRLTCTKAFGKYYVSIVFEEDLQKSVDNEQYIGLDWGLQKASDGAFFTGDQGQKFCLRELSEFEKKLRFRQRCLSKTKCGSKRHAKAKAKLGAVQERLNNVKKDSQAKLVHWLVQNYSHIAVEDLSMRGLVAINRGKQAKRKALLRYSNNDIIVALERKAFEFRKCKRFEPTSQRCSACGTIHKEMKNDRVRTIQCDCGLYLDRDVNAARNILSAAYNIYR